MRRGTGLAVATLVSSLLAGGAGAEQLTDFRDDGTGADVRVLRGSAIAPIGLPEPVQRGAVGAAGAVRGTVAVVGGERLWLVDGVSGEVVACRLRNTSTVGRSVVRCFEGDLPTSIGTD